MDFKPELQEDVHFVRIPYGPKENPIWLWKIIEGKYSGLTFEFGAIKILDDDEGASFNFEIYKDEDTEDSFDENDEQLQKVVGDVLQSVLYDYAMKATENEHQHRADDSTESSS